MKKISAFLIGIFSPLYFEILSALMLFTEYSEKYSRLQNFLILALPALPGIAIFFALRRDSLKDFFKAVGTCLLLSTAVLLLCLHVGLGVMIYKAAGHDEFALGEGFLTAIMFFSYIISCFLGTLVAGMISLYRRNKILKNTNISVNN